MVGIAQDSAVLPQSPDPDLVLPLLAEVVLLSHSAAICVHPSWLVTESRT